MKKNFKYLLFFLGMVFTLYLLIPFRNERCFWQKKFDSKGINGRVVKKKIDKSDHSTPILELENLETGKVDTISFLGERSTVFKIIKESDTLYKAIGSNRLYFIRGNEKKVIGTVNFGCDGRE
ncbi:hypothetical protein [Pedobacter flavus]|uniref:Uncharacterized protein n=1 Tax=Pedobacter flavus TaxID=3113906 RepID=A0ABU7H1C9_9SPHI|nr:hypothetical protein [Pedobacter sp. VNH31]MEE1885059.1 hypothetical protein [Pedobacter sp. VNH31]